MISRATRETLDAAMASIEEKRAPRETSTQCVGIGDSIRVIKTEGAYFASHREPRTGAWQQYERTTDESLTRLYDEAMTDKPTDVPPPWLTLMGGVRRADAHEPIMVPTFDPELVDWPRDDYGWMFHTLPEWLAWRSRVAEALGLVEPVHFTVEPIGAVIPRETQLEREGKAIAAELRRQAAAIDPGLPNRGRKSADEKAGEWIDFDVRTEIAAQLRSRADELDGG